MKRPQLDALSESLSKAISPIARKQEATTKILEQFEPLPLFGQSSTAPSRHQVGSTQGTGVKLRPVSKDTVSNLTPVSKLQGCEGPKKSGYLKVSNEILDQVLPTLDSSDAVVFLRLYRLSAGFNQTHCTVGITGLMRVCNVSESTCRRALRRLLELELIRQVEVVNTREVKGTTYQINTGIRMTPVSNLYRCHSDTGIKLTPNKDDIDDDDLKHNNHHQSANDDFPHLHEVKTAYCQITGNPWLPSDTDTYTENHIAIVPAQKAVEIMHGVKQRCGSRINSFSYFVKEIVSGSDSRNRQYQRRALAKIVKRIRDSHMGAHNYGIADFVYDVKQACAREGVIFDNDLFNSLNS